MRIRCRLVALAAVPALTLSVGLATATTASADAGSSTGPFNYEVDNGAQWQLSNTPISMTGANTGYADAGVVVSLGKLSDLNRVTVTGSGPLADNIWISSGNDNASDPGGPYPLGSDVDFAYGFDQGDGMSFWMMTDPGGSYAGQVATLSQLQSEHPDAQAFAWVGVTGNGAAKVSGHVIKVNGDPAGAYVNVEPDGTASAR